MAQFERAALKRQSLVHGMRYLNPTAEQRSAGKPETFDFLGFTHICGQSRQNGKFLILRKTVRKRLLAKLKELKEELRRWHEPVAELGKWLRSVVQDYFNYHAVPGNRASLDSFRQEVSKRRLCALRTRKRAKIRDEKPSDHAVRRQRCDGAVGGGTSEPQAVIAAQ